MNHPKHTEWRITEALAPARASGQREQEEGYISTHTHCSCPWCSKLWRMSPSTAIICFLIARLAGFVLNFGWNLPTGLVSLLIELSGITSSKNSSATSQSSSILSFLVYHRKPWLNKCRTDSMLQCLFLQSSKHKQCNMRQLRTLTGFNMHTKNTNVHEKGHLFGKIILAWCNLCTYNKVDTTAHFSIGTMT